MQLAIALLFTVTGLISLAIVGSTLRRAWSVAGELRAALARCDESQPLTMRSISIERRPVLRVIQGARTSRSVSSARCSLPVAA
jgi:hypothetical protein